MGKTLPPASRPEKLPKGHGPYTVRTLSDFPPVIATSTVTLDPRGHHRDNKYAPYREAWHLPRQPGRFNINACADVTWVDPSDPGDGACPELSRRGDGGDPGDSLSP